MKARRQFIRIIGGLTALFTLNTYVRASTAVSKGGNTKEPQGNFFHIVFFWLTDDSRETSMKFLNELKKFIEHVDIIKTRHIGTPADTDRDVIDNTWSYSLVLSFESKKEHDLYQEHPLHKDFIENASSLWKKVLVYDSLKAT